MPRKTSLLLENVLWSSQINADRSKSVVDSVNSRHVGRMTLAVYANVCAGRTGNTISDSHGYAHAMRP